MNLKSHKKSNRHHFSTQRENKPENVIVTATLSHVVWMRPWHTRRDEVLPRVGKAGPCRFFALACGKTVPMYVSYISRKPSTSSPEKIQLGSKLFEKTKYLLVHARGGTCAFTQGRPFFFFCPTPNVESATSTLPTRGEGVSGTVPFPLNAVRTNSHIQQNKGGGREPLSLPPVTSDWW